MEVCLCLVDDFTEAGVDAGLGGEGDLAGLLEP